MTDHPPIPRYRCHKEVEALWIVEVRHGGDGTDLIFASPYPPIRVTEDWIVKHQPYHGGFWVRYADGYESFSPGAAFEEGYSPVEQVQTIVTKHVGKESVKTEQSPPVKPRFALPDYGL